MKSLYVSIILILLCSDAHSQVYKSFQTRYTIGASLELLGVSPLGGAHVELMAFKRPNSFIDIQVGIGVISKSRDVWSFPQVITYNYWLNQRNNTRRKDCNPEKKEKKMEYFIEVGVCNLIIGGETHGEKMDYIFPVSGLRIHFPINHKSVIFAKLRYVPFTRYIHQSEFGLAVGTSL